MYSLTPRERKIYEAMLKRPNDVWTIERLADAVWGPVDEPGSEERTTSWRQALIGALMSLRIKTYILQDNRVVMVSKGRGRGNKGRYALRKTAKRLGLEVR